jgi:hypothetical protein
MPILGDAEDDFFSRLHFFCFSFASNKSFDKGAQVIFDFNGDFLRFSGCDSDANDACCESIPRVESDMLTF